MTRRLLVASIILYLVAIMHIAGGLYDIFIQDMALFHESNLGMTIDEFNPKFVALVLALFDSIGGFRIAIGLVILIMARGPFIRGDPGIKIMILILVVIGNSGNAIGMYNVGSLYYFPVLEIIMVLIAVIIARK